MANTSISNLAAGAAVSATDVLPNVQTAGVGPVKTTAAQLKTFMSASPTLVTPALGTPVSGNFSTGTFTWPTFNQNTSGTAAGLSATLAVTSGGTGLSTIATSRIPYATGTDTIGTSSIFTFNGTVLSVGTAANWSQRAIQTGSASFTAAGASSQCDQGANIYYNGGWKYITGSNTPATIFEQYNGAFYWYYGAGSANAGDAVSLSQPMILDTNGYLLIGYTSSNGAYRLQVNSQIFATSATIATSDAKYKKDIEPITGALAMVDALNPVTFNWKAHPVHAFDLTTKTTGFLAQEVQTALADKPFVNSLVKQSDCVLEKEVIDDKGNIITPAVTEPFLGIAEGNMIAILTAAIKELKAEFDAYKATHP